MKSNTSAWVNGFFGMLIFSGSLPATRIAVMEFDAEFLTAARAAIAGLFAVLALLVFKIHKPIKEDAIPLVITALGVVLGFPLLTALALQQMTAAHSIVFIALLPLMTALFGVLRAGEKPKALFWLFSILGSTLVSGYALLNSSAGSLTSNIYMAGAIIVCGLGYAEGAKLSRTLGGWQVICWALVISLPIMLVLAFTLRPASFASISIPAWMGLTYVSLFSMLIGFVFWYRGLAMGGIATVGQLQLLQPFFGLILAALLLGETVSTLMFVTCTLVMICVSAAKRFA